MHKILIMYKQIYLFLTCDRAAFFVIMYIAAKTLQKE